MPHHATKQSVLFGNLSKKAVIAKFDRQHASSDGGAILLKACDERLGLSGTLAACLSDGRQPSSAAGGIPDLRRRGGAVPVLPCPAGRQRRRQAGRGRRAASAAAAPAEGVSRGAAAHPAGQRLFRPGAVRVLRGNGLEYVVGMAGNEKLRRAHRRPPAGRRGDHRQHALALR